jgi:hypothetical protein
MIYLKAHYTSTGFGPRWSIIREQVVENTKFVFAQRATQIYRFNVLPDFGKTKSEKYRGVVCFLNIHYYCEFVTNEVHLLVDNKKFKNIEKEDAGYFST